MGTVANPTEKESFEHWIFMQRLQTNNENLRFSFQYNEAYKPHIETNQKMMRLTAESSVEEILEDIPNRLVVIGPGDMEIEPLKEKAKNFEEVLLVGCDGTVLRRIAKEIPGAMILVEDVTGGVHESFIGLLQKLRKPDYSFTEGMKDLKTIYTNYDPKKTLELAEKIGRARCVYCSCVSSILARTPISYTKDHFKHRYGKIPHLKSPEKQFISEVAITHLELLKKIGSTIYFSDTMRQEFGNGRVKHFTREGVENYINQNFTVVQRRIWRWNCSDTHSFKVMGVILKPKSQEKVQESSTL